MISRFSVLSSARQSRNSIGVIKYIAQILLMDHPALCLLIMSLLNSLSIWLRAFSYRNFERELEASNICLSVISLPYSSIITFDSRPPILVNWSTSLYIWFFVQPSVIPAFSISSLSLYLERFPNLPLFLGSSFISERVNCFKLFGK